jgi:hypothetical protein
MKEAYEETVGRRYFLKAGATAAVGLALSNNLRAMGAIAPATHNMLIVGMKSVFLYHLPMFSFKGFTSPHRYQIILEANFSQQGKTIQDVYLKERGKSPEKQIYTFSPEPFVFSSADDFPKKLKGTIYRGHLEKAGSTAIFKDVVAEITTALWFRELTLSYEQPQEPSRLQYIVFGTGQELFMAHLIYKAPDFDHILSAEDTGKQVMNYLQDPEPRGKTSTSISLVRRPLVELPRKNLLTQRLKQNQPIVGTFHKPWGSYIRYLTVPANIKVGTEYYFEEGELRAPPEFKATLAEQAAGFP